MGTPLSTARIWNLFRKRQHQRRGVQEGIDVHRDKAFFSGNGFPMHGVTNLFH